MGKNVLGLQKQIAKSSAKAIEISRGPQPSREVVITGKAMQMAEKERIAIKIEGGAVRAPRQFTADGWMLETTICGMRIGFAQKGVFGEPGIQALVVAELTSKVIGEFLDGSANVRATSAAAAESQGIDDRGEIMPGQPKLTPMRLQVTAIQLAHDDSVAEVRLLYIPPSSLTKDALTASNNTVQIEPLVDIAMPTYALAGLLDKLSRHQIGEKHR